MPSERESKPSMQKLLYVPIVKTGVLAVLLAPVGSAQAQTRGCHVESFQGMLPDARITSVRSLAEPVRHCKVEGVIGTETGFELLLPEEWNGKFIMGGGGGFVGSPINAAQDFHNVIARGWATVGTDAGHVGHSLDASWALNHLERQVSFGHQAVHRTAANAKPLIQAYYGRPAQRSLFFGCSRGGGQALMLAQRSPELFDGIYAGAPAYNWTLEMGARWTHIAQRMYPDPDQIVQPLLGADQVQLIGDAVMAQCDALDGLRDGVLNDPRQCDFDVTSLACSGEISADCLSPVQVEAAEAIYGDFDVGGEVARGTPVGGELPGNPLGWVRWFTGGFVPGEGLEYHVGADADGLRAPAVPNGTWAFAIGMMRYFIHSDPDWTYAGYDFSDFADKASRIAPTLNADNPDLSRFRARGGKLIIDNGWMDGSLSAYGTLDYYERVLEHDPTAREDVRLFIRPGVTHCLGGPGPDGTDYITALEVWLDTGVAPDQLDAPYVQFATRKPTGGGRIICAHPGVVTYDGRGDSRDPGSFSCEVPK